MQRGENLGLKEGNSETDATESKEKVIAKLNEMKE